jgi:hypothetical protein
MEEAGRFIRGVVDEASVITTDKGAYKRITVVAPRAVDEETGTIIKTLRSLYFREVYMSGQPVSELELLALRGYRVEIHCLADNTAEIRIID